MGSFIVVSLRGRKEDEEEEVAEAAPSRATESGEERPRERAESENGDPQR